MAGVAHRRSVVLNGEARDLRGRYMRLLIDLHSRYTRHLDQIEVHR